MNKSKLRAIINKLDDGGLSSVPEVIQELKELGAIQNQHVGRTDLSDSETVEWYAGQALDLLETKSYFAVNALINCLDKFCPQE